MMGSTAWHWCPRGCGKSLQYEYTDRKTKTLFYFCNRCKCRYEKEELISLGFIKRKKRSGYKPRKKINAHDLRKLV